MSDFKKLTLSSNAINLGWMGFIAGGLTVIAVLVAFRYIGPVVYWYGYDKGWWT